MVWSMIFRDLRRSSAKSSNKFNSSSGDADARARETKCTSSFQSNGILYIFYGVPLHQERPYQLDSTASRLLSEVKQARVCLVLRWGTTLESQMLFFLHFLLLL